MARTTRGSSMNAMIRIALSQSGQTSGSAAKTFLMNLAQLARGTFVVAVSSEIGTGQSGSFSLP